jgi:hypothetical protein
MLSHSAVTYQAKICEVEVPENTPANRLARAQLPSCHKALDFRYFREAATLLLTMRLPTGIFDCPSNLEKSAELGFACRR